MSDHIPDLTKMISDTPRTDKESFFPHDSKYKVCDSDFARQLERELNAANVDIERLTNKVAQLYEGAEEAQQRIKRLEEALDLVRPHCSFVHHSKKHQHAYDEPCPVVALIEKAKEAKL